MSSNIIAPTRWEGNMIPILHPETHIPPLVLTIMYHI